MRGETIKFLENSISHHDLVFGSKTLKALIAAATRKLNYGLSRAGSAVKNTCCSCRGPGVVSSTSSQFSVTPTSGALMPPCGLCQHQAHVWSICNFRKAPTHKQVSDLT